MNNERIYYSHEAEVHAVRAMTQLMVLCLMVGLGIGAAVALLFAPNTGKATRHDLTHSVEERLQTGRDSVEPLLKRLQAEFAELRKTVDERINHA